jgi:hypothetical protein
VAEPVDIILLSYNRLDYLAAMVDAIEQRTRRPYRLTIVDNASGPATRQWLREHAARFHQIIWNERNEHLAGLQRGIEATTSELFVISDADLVVAEPTAAGCWLERLVALAERHPDFALIAVSLDSVSAARNARLQNAPLIDGELRATPTGVWLNLIRRSALRVPYVSDGITAHALRRSGYRVGIATEVSATHLGDADPQRHPDYLARKQAASGWATTYPDYPESRESAPPPTLRELALAAPVLAALERYAIARADTVELRAPRGTLAAVAPEIAAGDAADLAPAGARAIAILAPREGAAAALIESAFALAGEWVVLLSSPAVPEPAPEWALAGEFPGPHPVIAQLAALASRPRWRARLLYSTSEHRAQWLALFAAACFGEDQPLRVYVFRRTPALAPVSPALAARRPAPSLQATRRPRVRRRRLGALATKARRLVQAEWRLARTRGRAR